MLHPLEDFSRVVFKNASNKIDELKDASQQIVFSDVESSIVITYNKITDKHSVWRLRRATPEEMELGVIASRPDTGPATSMINTTNQVLNS